MKIVITALIIESISQHSNVVANSVSAIKRHSPTVLYNINFSTASTHKQGTERYITTIITQHNWQRLTVELRTPRYWLADVRDICRQSSDAIQTSNRETLSTNNTRRKLVKPNLNITKPIITEWSSVCT